MIKHENLIYIIFSDLSEVEHEKAFAYALEHIPTESSMPPGYHSASHLTDNLQPATESIRRSLDKDWLSCIGHDNIAEVAYQVISFE